MTKHACTRHHTSVLGLLLIFRRSPGYLAKNLGVQHLVVLARLGMGLSGEVVHLVLVLVVQDRHRVDHQDSCWDLK